MIGRRSRYRFSILCQGAEGTFLGNRPRIDTAPRPDDRTHPVVQGDRLDVLAHRYLGDAALWWVIAEYNDLDWPLDLAIGTTLRVPSYRHVEMDILG